MPESTVLSPAGLHSIPVRDAMHAPIVACPPDTELDHVAKLMASHRVHAVVVDGIRGDKLVWGVVTDLDLLRAALDASGATDAAGAARTEALTVDSADDLALVSRRLVEHACSHAIVVEGERPVGVISTLDVAAAIAAP